MSKSHSFVQFSDSQSGFLLYVQMYWAELDSTCDALFHSHLTPVGGNATINQSAVVWFAEKIHSSLGLTYKAVNSKLDYLNKLIVELILDLRTPNSRWYESSTSLYNQWFVVIWWTVTLLSEIWICMTKTHQHQQTNLWTGLGLLKSNKRYTF